MIEDTSPLPWKFIDKTQDKDFEKEYDASYEVWAANSKDYGIINDMEYYNTAPSKDDAKMIVHRVNAYDGLLKIIRTLDSALSNIQPDYKNTGMHKNIIENVLK